VEAAVHGFRSQGAVTVEVELPNTALAVPAYYVIAPAEASSNLSRFDGVRYGHRAADYADLTDMLCRTRAEGFGAEVRQRILVGTYVLSHGYYDAYYLQAQKVRRLIARDFALAFRKCDLILGPTAPTTAFELGARSADPVQMYLGDIFTIPAPLAGLPALSVPCGFDERGLPVGLQLTGPHFSEALLRPVLILLLALFSFPVLAQGKTETRELVGQVGSRSALMVLQAAQRADGSWQVSGEYVLLPTMVRRYVEGERSPEIGVTILKEGSSAILFGRPPTGELRGAWRGARFSGSRYGPGGQERERFEFSEEFPAMDGYSAGVRCEAGEGRYRSSLSYVVEAGRLKSFDWRSSLAPSDHACAVTGAVQRPLKGGLRALAGRRCSITLRDLGDFVRVAAENCAEHCGSQAYLEPLLVDRRGNCKLLRPETR
jgi:hypothetical protein